MIINRISNEIILRETFPFASFLCKSSLMIDLIDETLID
jgi:hypothetical protein